MTPIDLIGLTLSLGGVALSAYGSYILNQHKDHTHARVVFTISNPMMFVWCVGYIMQWWDGMLPIAALAGLYLFYCASSVHGWLR